RPRQHARREGGRGRGPDLPIPRGDSRRPDPDRPGGRGALPQVRHLGRHDGRRHQAVQSGWRRAVVRRSPGDDRPVVAATRSRTPRRRHPERAVFDFASLLIVELRIPFAPPGGARKGPADLPTWWGGEFVNTSRVEAFSDGVFAVAITLLVLQFTVPEVGSGRLLATVLSQWPQLVTYVATFLTVGVVWINHHTIFRNLRAVDRTIQFINLVLLMTVVLLPYPTALLGRYLNSGQNGSVAAAFYAVVMTLMAIAFQALVAWALTHPNLLRPEVQGARPRTVLPRFALGLIIYAVSIGIAFVSTWLVVALYAFNAVYYAFNQLSWGEARK